MTQCKDSYISCSQLFDLDIIKKNQQWYANLLDTD